MRALVLALRVLGALLALSPVAPPVLHALGLHAVAQALDEPWTMTCHRLPERTMTLLGVAMPMCSRCTGLVSGLGLGLLVGAPYRGPAVLRWTVLGAAALLVIEMETQEWGWHPVWHVTRLLTGFLLAYPIGAAVTALAARPPESDAPEPE